MTTRFKRVYRSILSKYLSLVYKSICWVVEFFLFFSITQQSKKRSKEENRVRYTLNQRISKLVVDFDRYDRNDS